MTPFLLQKLVPNCTGCYACSNICPSDAITIKELQDGHLYPVINEEICVDCKTCLKVCPEYTKRTFLHTDYPAKAYAAWNKNEEIHRESSSGGIFTELASSVIRHGGCVFGAAFDESLDVCHIKVETMDELSLLRGSKYRQSHLTQTFRQIRKELRTGRVVLFSGTPCQIAGLKGYLFKDPENLICIDVACHGVPSAKLFRKYRSWWEEEVHSNLEKIQFRDKSSGWMSFQVFRQFSSGKQNATIFKYDYYMQAFLRDVCLRPSCYNCRFTSVERPGDLTLADFWGIEKIHPDWDISRGVSLLFVNSAKGEQLWASVSGKVFSSEESIAEAVKYNPVFRRRAAKHPLFDEFHQYFDELPLPELIETWCPPQPRKPRPDAEQK